LKILTEKRQKTNYSPFFRLFQSHSIASSVSDRATTRSLSDFADSTITALRHLIVALYTILSVLWTGVCRRRELARVAIVLVTIAYAGAHHKVHYPL